MRIDATAFLLALAVSGPAWAQGGEWTARTDINVGSVPRATALQVSSSRWEATTRSV